jgi:hypothetical protein
MAHYRAYFIGSHGRVEAVHEFDSTKDEAAIEVARKVLARRDSSVAFELWRDAVRVHAEPKKPIP